jgi:uncharacterized protein DUF4202
MADLVADALAWVDEIHPHARHLAHTLDWLLVLEPHADEALQIAAVAHDAERAFPAPAGSPRGTDDPTSSVYERWHQDRSAQIIGDWLRERGADAALINQVRALVRVHEDGGSPEADLLQAADSLSFLEVQVELFAGLVARGELSRRQADRKLHRMYDRIAPGRARELAAPMLAAALTRIATVETPAPEGEGEGR